MSVPAPRTDAPQRGPQRAAERPHPVFDPVLLALLLGCGLALRLEGIDRPLWLDEAVQVRLALSPDVGTWLEALATEDLHPPLGSALTGLVALADRSPWAVRLPSLLASLATIPLAWWAGRAWGSIGAARLSAMLVTVLPPLVRYGVEARPYALGIALLTACLAAAGARRAGLLAVLGGAAAATLYGAWPVVALAGALHARRPGPRRWLPLGAFGVVAGLLSVTLLPLQLAHQGAGLPHGFLAPRFWTPTTLLDWAMRQPNGLVGWVLTGLGGPLVEAIGGFGVAVLLGLVLRARRDDLLLLAWVPVLVLGLLAGVGLHPFGPTRHALVLVPGMVLWVSRRLDHRPTAFLPVMALAVVALGRRPELPVEDAPALVAELDALDDRLLVIDASAAPQVRLVTGRATRELPWVRGERLVAALDTVAPAESFWMVVGDTRLDVLPEVEAWATDRGRTLGPLVVREGIRARRVGPAATMTAGR